MKSNEMKGDGLSVRVSFFRMEKELAKERDNFHSESVQNDDLVAVVEGVRWLNLLLLPLIRSVRLVAVATISDGNTIFLENVLSPLSVCWTVN
jgi:hypothetical protein